jgi:hypothetical protein
MRLAIEFDNGPGYGHIHAAGCRDLRDPEIIGEADTVTEANRLAHELTGWDDGEDDPDGYRFAPCAAKTLR